MSHSSKLLSQKGLTTSKLGVLEVWTPIEQFYGTLSIAKTRYLTLFFKEIYLVNVLGAESMRSGGPTCLDSGESQHGHITSWQMHQGRNTCKKES